MQLLLVFSLFFFSLTLSSPSDVLYIEKLVADKVQAFDAKNFIELANIFTKNATVVISAGPKASGIDAIQALLASIYLPEVITHSATSTFSITLLPPFDEQGAAGTATGMVYATFNYIGQGNLTGQALTFFAKYEDNYVKTDDFVRHGGWRNSQSFFVIFGEVVGNRDVLPPSLRAQLPP
ncbi:hypothetical protein MMC22_009695 [Lobaria immixta]|nr:hypothetical protein [Lobaria immixta]